MFRYESPGGISLSTTTSIQLVRLALQAAEKKLGIEELARRLKAPDTLVRTWRDGYSAIPQSKFELLISVMSDVDEHWKSE
jgi:hypothetical protein